MQNQPQLHIPPPPSPSDDNASRSRFRVTTKVWDKVMAARRANVEATHDQLAHISGVSRATVSAILRGAYREEGEGDQRRIVPVPKHELPPSPRALKAAARKAAEAPVAIVTTPGAPTSEVVPLPPAKEPKWKKQCFGCFWWGLEHARDGAPIVSARSLTEPLVKRPCSRPVKVRFFSTRPDGTLTASSSSCQHQRPLTEEQIALAVRE